MKPAITVNQREDNNMVEKDPNTWTWGTWALATCIPIAGGIVNWYHKVKRGHTRAFNLIELIGEIFTSGFVGLMVFLGLSSLEYPIGLCAAASGVSGHMATRLLFLVETYLEAFVTARTPKEDK
jgi:hypothetical protein